MLASLACVSCGSSSKDDSTTGGGGAAGEGGSGAGNTDLGGSEPGTGGNPSEGGAPGTGGAPAEGDGNDSFETAEEFPGFDESVSADLEMTGDKDYYTFEGTEGQAIQVAITAQGDDPANSFAAEYIDAVVTLYDADKQMIAQNDDPYGFFNNDSILNTILPADGKYYLRVTECWTYAEETGAQCKEPAEKEFTDYEVFIGELPAAPGFVPEEEPNDQADNATVITGNSVDGTDGKIYFETVWGSFSSDGDLDIFKITVPDDVGVPEGSAPMLTLDMLPWGPEENGSTTSIGAFSLKDDQDNTIAVVNIDNSDPDKGTLGLAVPVTLGSTYLLHVDHPVGDLGANPFYFLRGRDGFSNPLEMDEAGNGELAGAEEIVLDESTEDAGSFSGFVAGNLPDEMDADFFRVTIPVDVAGDARFSVYCGAWTSGSGVRGLTATVYNGQDELGSATEVETDGLAVEELAIPNGATELLVKVNAAEAPEADVTGRYYRCGVAFAPPAQN